MRPRMRQGCKLSRWHSVRSEVVRGLFDNGVEGSNADLPFQLHAKGLFNVRREKGVSSLEELAESIEDPTIAKEFGSKSRET